MGRAERRQRGHATTYGRRGELAASSNAVGHKALEHDGLQLGTGRVWHRRKGGAVRGRKASEGRRTDMRERPFFFLLRFLALFPLSFSIGFLLRAAYDECTGKAQPETKRKSAF